MAKGDKAVTKAARACDECYETVFPLLEPLSELDETPAEGEPTSEQQNTPSLSGLPLWRTITNPAPAASTAGALMAMTRKGLPATAAPSAPMDGEDDEALQGEPIPDVGEGRRRVRGRGRGTAARPRSYYEILEDFQSHDEGALTDLKMGTESPSETGTIVGGSVIDLASDTARETERRRAREGVKEDTARKLKRFSMPAVALQTTSVLARTVEVPAGSVGVGAGRVRRFSLIPGKGAASAASKAGADVSVSGKRELGRGVAAGKLSELLGRRTKPVPA
jgi:FYVE/RhoGEF/PH domain-containing protein 5/6